MYNNTVTPGKVLGASTVAGASAGALSQLPQTSGLNPAMVALYAIAFLLIWGISYLAITKAVKKINVKRENN